MTASSLEHSVERVAHHLVTLRVENKAGVLVRVAGLFARRGFNIFSLAVAPTDDERFSRISIVVDAESAPLEQVVSQLNKLINVVEISEMAPDEAREVELLLATVRLAPGLEGVLDAAGARRVDRSETAMMVTLEAEPATLDQFERQLASFGIVELQRTGRIALSKLSADVEAPR
jgi:acetolactate synthase-1/3 small subunit